jgi:hypothetical protein
VKYSIKSRHEQDLGSEHSDDQRRHELETSGNKHRSKGHLPGPPKTLNARLARWFLLALSFHHLHSKAEIIQDREGD